MQKKYKKMYPLKNKNLVNLSNSIIKVMGIETHTKSLKEIDKILRKKEYKNIVLLLFDGMGCEILEKFLPKEALLRKNKICNISSVFPATTVAATTSILTGLYPSEHGWMGWDMYFSDDNEIISVYRNTIKDTNILAKHTVESRKEMQYKTIIERINEETNYKAYFAWEFDRDNKCSTLNEIKERIYKLCNEPEKKFIYGYYANPDKSLHENGFDSEIVKNECIKINSMVEELYNNTDEDTIIIVIADHGHLECEFKTLSENKKLYNMLERSTALEPRACSIKLKKDIDKKEFEKIFLKEFGQAFKLYQRDEVIKKQLFGCEIKKRIVYENIADYIAIAISNICIRYDENGKIFKTYHAGITKEEMEIPLIVLKK